MAVRAALSAFLSLASPSRRRQAALQKDVLGAMARNQWDAIDRAIEQGLDANQPVPEESPMPKNRFGSAKGQTLLMIAAQSGLAEAVEKLLPVADARATDPAGWTALMFANLAPDRKAARQCVKLLIPNSNVAAANANGATALMMHASDPLAVAELLPLSDPLATAVGGETALMRAAEAGAVKSVSLLAAVSDTRHLDEQGRSALMRAVEKGEIGSADGRGRAAAIVKILAPISDVLAQDNEGATALLRAAKRGLSGAVCELLAVSSDAARVADRQGKTPLMAAAENGDIESIRALLPASEINAQTQMEQTALMFAVVEESVEAVRILAPLSDLSMAAANGDQAFSFASRKAYDVSRMVPPQPAAGHSNEFEKKWAILDELASRADDKQRQTAVSLAKMRKLDPVALLPISSAKTEAEELRKIASEAFGEARPQAAAAADAVEEPFQGERRRASRL